MERYREHQARPLSTFSKVRILWWNRIANVLSKDFSDLEYDGIQHELTIGGINPDRYLEPLTWSMGNHEGNVDTRTSLIIMPPADARQIYEANLGGGGGCIIYLMIMMVLPPPPSTCG
ncbi:9065_t:CDS:2 [Funneliformis caledonium]|uniref:9065_t:CDS:1 n=1 Tax=Funneliformis caledonium TaxID=1117310 RepID=A0A9N9HBP7_9GLOM|nr:9065_t:CDS:2 [Funneliformis caledonium]